MRFFYILIPGLFFLFPSGSIANRNLDMAQSVLNRLYFANGQFNIAKPQIELIDTKQNVAIYQKSKHRILIEKFALELCRSFGKDSLDALAFILSHELIHALQSSANLTKSSFIAYDQYPMSSLEIERNADIQGVFISYLAGFKTIHILPEIIDRMYEQYSLRNKKIKGYPSEEERKASSALVVDQVNKLIELFELSNQFSVIGEYPAAISCLEYISKYYKGKEVFNNLGVNYTLMALNITSLQSEFYIYPLELDWNLRIKKPKTGRGDLFIDPLELLEQQNLLRKAKYYFEITINYDPKFIQAKLNVYSTLMILNDLKLAQEYFDKNLSKIKLRLNNHTMISKVNLAQAIWSAKANRKNEAIAIWTSLLKDKDEIISNQARHNLGYITNNETVHSLNSITSCEIMKLAEIPEADINIQATPTEKWIDLDSSFQINIKFLKHSVLYSFLKEGQKIVNIQKIPLEIKSNSDLSDMSFYSLGNNKKIYHCRSSHSVYLMDGSEVVNYMIRYYVFSEIGY